MSKLCVLSIAYLVGERAGVWNRIEIWGIKVLTYIFQTQSAVDPSVSLSQTWCPVSTSKSSIRVPRNSPTPIPVRWTCRKLSTAFDPWQGSRRRGRKKVERRVSSAWREVPPNSYPSLMLGPFGPPGAYTFTDARAGPIFNRATG